MVALDMELAFTLKRSNSNTWRSAKCLNNNSYSGAKRPNHTHADLEIVSTCRPTGKRPLFRH